MTEKTLRVVTSNIRWDNPDDGEHRWGRRKFRLLDLLRGWGPDILGLQEVLAGPFAEIRSTLPEFASLGVGREDGKEAGEFCPIFYRAARFDLADGGTFWFSDTPDAPGSRHWGNRHPRLCTWAALRDRESGATFSFYNLHWDHESAPARDNSAGLLLDRIGGRPAPGPVIVVGDFNAEAGDSAVARLSAPASPAPTSALAAAHGDPPGTFHGFTGAAPGTPIDHVFVSPEWEVLDAEILRGDGARPFASDHFPVAAILRLSGGAA